MINVGDICGELTITAIYSKYIESSKRNRKYVSWVCSCGVVGETRYDRVLSGRSKSCGCLAIKLTSERSTGNKYAEKHGMCGTRPHSIWLGMIARTTQETASNYQNYGGVGITLEDSRWLNFKEFWADMGGTYVDNSSLDRIDNSRGYSKENCRWATKNLQQHNRDKVADTGLPIGVFSIKNSHKYFSTIKDSLNVLNRVGYSSPNVYLGTFTCPTEAALVYDNYSEIIYGDRPNNTVRSNT